MAQYRLEIPDNRYRLEIPEEEAAFQLQLPGDLPEPLPDRPAATVAEQEGWFNKLLDWMLRTSYGADNALNLILQGNLNLGDISEAYRQGLTGEIKGSGYDIATERLGLEGGPVQPRLFSFRLPMSVERELGGPIQVPVPVPSPASVAGLAIDVANPLDPLNWGLRIGQLGRTGEVAQRFTSAIRGGEDIKAGSRLLQEAQQLRAAGRTGEQLVLGGTAAEQAARGQRNLIGITIPGVGALGPSDLPGEAGRIAARVQEPVFRALEAGRDWLLAQAPIQRAIGLVSTMPLTPAAKVERILRDEDRVARYLMWKARNEERAFSEVLDELAEQLGVEPSTIRSQITEAAQRLERAGDLDPRAAVIAERIRARQPERLAEEQALGVPTRALQSERTAYLHREPTEEFGEWLNQYRRQRPQGARPGALTLLEGPQIGRRIAPDATIAEINQAAMEGRTAIVPSGRWVTIQVRPGDTLSEIARRHKTTVEELARRNDITDPDAIKAGQRIQVPELIYGITDDVQDRPALPRMALFTEDPAVIERAREIDHIRVTSSARALDNVIARGLEEGWIARAPSTAQLQPGWTRVDLVRFGDKFKGLAVPNEVADVLQRFAQKWEDKESQNLVLQALERFTSWWRNQTLFPIPAYHTRNFMTGVWKNYLADMNPTHYADGATFAQIRGGLADPSSLQFTSATGRVWTGEEVLDEYMKHGLGIGFFEQFEPVSGRGLQQINPLSSQNLAVEAGQWIGTRVEDILRGSLFIDGLKKGLSPRDAAERVFLYQFDYQDIPETIKQARRYLAPFISWSVKNIPHELASTIQQPYKLGRVVRGARSWEVSQGAPEGGAAPDYLQLPIYMGEDEMGRPIYSNFLQTLSFYDLAEFISNPEGMFRYAVNQLGPFTTAFEVGLNYNLFTGQPITSPALKEAGVPEMVPLIGPLPGRPEGIITEARTAEALRSLYRPLDVLSRLTTAPDQEQALLQALTSVRGYPASPYEPYSEALDLNRAYQELLGMETRLNQQALEAVASGDERRVQLIRQQLAALQAMLSRFEERMRGVMGR